MPSRVEQPARRETTAREAARRAAVDTLKIAEAIAGYSAEQIGNGLSPAEATRAALGTAAELELIAGTLRRLTRLNRLGSAERRALAVELASDGLSQRAIAGLLGVSHKVIWKDLRAARGL